MEDNPKYRYETKIYSIDKKFEKVFTGKRFLEKINQCIHITSLAHIKKDTILDVEKSLLPLKPQASTLLIEIKGEYAIATMSLEDFFILLILGKRIKITKRPERKSLREEVLDFTDEDIQDFLREISGE